MSQGKTTTTSESLVEVSCENGLAILQLNRVPENILQLAKRAQVESYYSSWGEALYRVENLYLRELMTLEDSEEGLRAAAEERDPIWTNS